MTALDLKRIQFLDCGESQDCCALCEFVHGTANGGFRPSRRMLRLGLWFKAVIQSSGTTSALRYNSSKAEANMARKPR